MRRWLRIAVTLILAPLLWRLVTGYIATGSGATWHEVIADSGPILLDLYIAYSLPALALVVLILLPADLLLERLGGDLLIVFVAPLLAVLTLVIVGLVVESPRFPLVPAMLFLAFVYGLVYGLTIREPRTKAAVIGRSV